MITGFPNLSGYVDRVFIFIVGIALFFLILVTFLMVFFVIRYRRDRNPEPEDIEGNLLLEIIWTLVPTVIVLAMFYYGYVGFKIMRTPPGDALVVKAVGRKWSWSFRYENGKTSDLLRVPLKKPVKLVITSEDVLHSLYIPAFRVKEDAVPGAETFLWFYPDEEGEYELFCAEYCGMGHSSMMSKVVVMPVEKFALWLGEQETISKIERGKVLIAEKGCVGCHSYDGTRRIGPTFRGLYMSKRVVVVEGEEVEVVADEKYILRALYNPSGEVVKGYSPIMPSQKGKVTEKEAEDIIEYLKTIR